MNDRTNAHRYAIYARVSSAGQDVDLSITAQVKAMEDYVQEHAGVVARSYADEAESGRTDKRPQFQKMIADALSDDCPFDEILVWKYSRFARNRRDAIVHKTVLRERGIKVTSIKEPADDTPAGGLTEGVIEVLDEFFSRNLSEDVVRGMRESASRGFWLSKVAPIGYKKVYVDDGGKRRPRLALDPPHDALVKRIFEMAAAGMSLRTIVRILNGEGLTTAKGKKWGTSSLHAILKNETYTGMIVWGRTSKHDRPPLRVEDAHPAIVSRELFDQVQEVLREKAPTVMHPRRAGSNYLLSGLVKCKACGFALIAAPAKSGQYTYYVCTSVLKRGPEDCDTPRFSVKKLDRRVVGAVRKRILTPEHLRDLMHLVADEMEGVEAEARGKLAGIEKELSRVIAAVENLWSAVEKGDLDTSDIQPRLHKHHAHQEELQAALAEARAVIDERRELLASAEVVEKYATRLNGLLAASAASAKKMFLRSFVKDILVDRDGIAIRYTIPTPRESEGDPDDTEDALPGVVPVTVQYGAPAHPRSAPAGLLHRDCDGASHRGASPVTGSRG